MTLLVGAAGLALLLLGCGQEPGGSDAERTRSGDPVPVEDRIDTLIAQLEEPLLRGNARLELQALGERAVPKLVEHLRTGSSIVRYEIAQLMGKAGDQRTLVVLATTVLQDEDDRVRQSAMRAIRNFPQPTFAVAQFQAALQSAEPDIRWNAALALGEIGNADGLDLLYDALQPAEDTADDRVAKSRRRSVIKVLAHVHDDKTAEVLGNVFPQLDEIDRQEAVMTLRKIADEPSRDLLIAALEDESARVRWKACFGLGTLRDPAAIDALEALQAKETDEQVKKQVEISLKKLVGLRRD